MLKKRIFYFLTFLVFSLSALPTYSKKILTLKKTKDFSDGTADENAFTYLRDIFDTPIFFETGTYNGKSALKFARIFSKLYTVELADSLYEESNDRLRNCINVYNYKDDSAAFLQKVVPTVSGKKFFFLDAHGCGGKSAPGHPILQELRALKQLNVKDCVIMIDDARGLKLEGEISLKSVYKLLKEINSEFTIIAYSDSIIAYHNDNVIPSAVVDACTKSTFFDPEIDDIHEVLKAEQIISRAEQEEQKALLRLTFPETALYHVWRGLVHLNKREFQEAQHLLNLAIKKGYNHPRIRTYISTANYFLASA